MTNYNGYSGAEREAKLRDLHRLKRAGEFPSPPDQCSLCGDPDVALEPHSEDYSQEFLWTAPAMYWLCRHCHREKLHKRFARPDAWRALLLHVRRGGYARELKTTENKRELGEATKAIAASKTPTLRVIRSRKLDGEQWWEQLTLDPESRDSAQARPRP